MAPGFLRLLLGKHLTGNEGNGDRNMPHTKDAKVAEGGGIVTKGRLGAEGTRRVRLVLQEQRERREKGKRGKGKSGKLGKREKGKVRDCPSRQKGKREGVAEVAGWKSKVQSRSARKGH